MKSSLLRRIRSTSVSPLFSYVIGGITPAYVMDTEEDFYYARGTIFSGPNQLHDHATTSNRTVVDSDGLIKWAPHNLQSLSADFSLWGVGVGGTGVAPTITPSQQDNFGGNTASRIQMTIAAGETASDICEIYNNFTAVTGAQYTEGFFIRSYDGVSSYSVNFRGTDFATNIKSITGAWTYVSADTVATSTLGAFYIQLRGSLATSKTADFLICRARAFRSDLGGMQSTGNAADPTYVPTSGSAVYWMGTDHDPVTGEVLGVQGEPAATNKITYYNKFDDASWGLSNTAIAEASGVNSPLNEKVWLCTNTVTVSGEYIFRNITIAGTANQEVFWIFAKKKDFDWLLMRLNNGAWYNASFNIANGTLGTLDAGFDDHGIIDYGNGWYLCYAVMTGRSDTKIQWLMSDSDGGFTFTPSATGLGTYLTGAHVVESADLPSSVIPTNGATATRAALNVSKPTGEFMPLGGNIVSNGGFDTDASGWTIGGSGAYNSGAVDLDVPGATVALSQSVGVNPVGKLWRLEYTITNHVSGNLRPQFGSTNGAFSTGNGTFVDYIFANSTNSTLLFVNGGVAYQATIDNISIQEVQQDEIVVVTEFECADVAADAVVAALDDASTDLIHFRAHTSQANLFVQDGGVTQADVDAGAISADVNYRAAFKIAADDFAASLAGATAVTDTSGTMPTPTTLRLFNSSGAGALAGIRLKKLIVYAGAAGSLDAITDAVVEETAQPSEVPSLQLIFDDSETSFTDTGLTI